MTGRPEKFTVINKCFIITSPSGEKELLWKQGLAVPSHPPWNLTKVTTEWGQGLKRCIHSVPPDAKAQTSKMA